jgi:uncharacterized protein
VPSTLVDTGPLVAIADRRDKHHARCLSWLERFDGTLVTTWAVLTEFSHLVPSLDACRRVYQWARTGDLRIVALGGDELGVAIDWMAQYDDLPMDLADASLVVAAIRTGVTTVWTLDRRDFEVYRLPKRKRFRIVG